MRVLTFESVSVWNFIISCSSYSALAGVIALWFKLQRAQRQSGRRSDDSLRGRGQSALRPSQAQLADEVRSWGRVPGGQGARLVGASHAPAPAPAIPETPLKEQTTAPVPDQAVNRHTSGPKASVSLARAPAVVDIRAGVVDEAADGDAGFSGDESKVDVGVFMGGRGKKQDRQRVGHIAVGAGGELRGMYAVLSDGMSSVGDGGRAADVAMESFVSELNRQMVHAEWLSELPIRPTRYLDALWRAAEKAHDAVRRLSRDPLLRGSAATLEAALLLPGSIKSQYMVALVHVGDGMIARLSDVQGLQPLTDSQASNGTLRNALGLHPTLRGEVRLAPLPIGTKLVLATDGFGTPAMNAAEGGLPAVAGLLPDAAERTPPQDVADLFGRYAAKRSADDVSVVVLAPAQSPSRSV